MEFKQKIIDFLKKQHVINFKTKNCCWDKFVKDNCQKVGMVCNTWYKSIDYIHIKMIHQKNIFIKTIKKM